MFVQEELQKKKRKSNTVFPIMCKYAYHLKSFFKNCKKINIQSFGKSMSNGLIKIDEISYL